MGGGACADLRAEHLRALDADHRSHRRRALRRLGVFGTVGRAPAAHHRAAAGARLSVPGPHLHRLDLDADEPRAVSGTQRRYAGLGGVRRLAKRPVTALSTPAAFGLNLVQCRRRSKSATACRERSFRRLGRF